MPLKITLNNDERTKVLYVKKTVESKGVAQFYFRVFGGFIGDSDTFCLIKNIYFSQYYYVSKIKIYIKTS